MCLVEGSWGFKGCVVQWVTSRGGCRQGVIFGFAMHPGVMLLGDNADAMAFGTLSKWMAAKCE